MTPVELKRALKRITANTKRLAKLTAPPKPRRRRTFYVPPRAPEPVVEPYFATPPTPPVRWKGPCKARCALTGRQCGLLANHDGAHATARGPFVLAAAPGQTLFGKREVDRYAFASVAVSDEFSSTQLKRFERKAKRKVSAHLGHATTAGNNEKASDLRRGA